MGVSRLHHYGEVAQLAVQLLCKQKDEGSNPFFSTMGVRVARATRLPRSTVCCRLPSHALVSQEAEDVGLNLTNVRVRVLRGAPVCCTL